MERFNCHCNSFFFKHVLLKYIPPGHCGKLKDGACQTYKSGDIIKWIDNKEHSACRELCFAEKGYYCSLIQYSTEYSVKCSLRRILTEIKTAMY